MTLMNCTDTSFRKELYWYLIQEGVCLKLMSYESWQKDQEKGKYFAFCMHQKKCSKPA